MKFGKFAGFVALLAVTPSWAGDSGPGISDPNGILPLLDSFLGNADFTSAFHSGDQWTYSQKDCLGQTGAGPCDEMNSGESAEVGTDAVLTTTVDGRPTGTETITRQDWLDASGSAIRMRIASLNSASYTVTMESSQASQASVEVNGTPQTFATLKVSFNATNLAGISIHEMIEITKDLPGIAQVVGEERVTSGLAAGVTNLSLTSFRR